MSDDQDQAPTPDKASPPSPGVSARQPSKERSRAHLIGERLRMARRAIGLTQQELAGHQFSKSYISAIERGKMTPSLPALTILADRLGVPVSTLLGEGELDLDTLAARHAASPGRTAQEYVAYEQAAWQRLSEAEALIRQDQPQPAWEALGDEPANDLPTQLRATWYWLAGWAATLAGRHEEAIRLLERGLSLAEPLLYQKPYEQQTQLVEPIAWLHCFRGVAYCGLGQLEQALEAYRQGLDAIDKQEIANRELIMLLNKGLGNVYLTMGRYQEAIPFYLEALKQAKDLHNLRQRGLAAWGLGVAYHQVGDFYRARTQYQHALDAVGSQENWPLVAQVRALLGEVLTKLEHYEEADYQLHKSLESAQRLGDRHTMANALLNLAVLSLARGKPERLLRLANEALQQLQPGEDPLTVGQLHLTLAEFYMTQHNIAATEQALKRALEILEPTPLRLLLSQARERYGQFLAEQGRFEEAFEQMRQTEETG